MRNKTKFNSFTLPKKSNTSLEKKTVKKQVGTQLTVPLSLKNDYTIPFSMLTESIEREKSILMDGGVG